MKNRKTIVDIVAYMVAFLFIYAASAKLLEYDLFEAQIGKSPLITDYSDTVAWGIPSAELIIAIILFLPTTRIYGLFAGYSLMLLFTLYISFILLFSPYVPCSCGGILSHMGWTEHLIFNIAFTILPLVAIKLYDDLNSKFLSINAQSLAI